MSDDNQHHDLALLAGAEGQVEPYFFKAVVDALDEGVAVYDRELRYAFVSRFFTEASGYSAEELIGQNPEEVFPALGDEGWRELVQKAFDGQTVETDDRLWDSPKHGSPIWLRSTYSPMRTDAGDIVAVVAVVRVVTDRKRADETALKLAREEAKHAEARAAQKKAEQLEQLKSSMLANMSHEIRTPLTSIVLQAEVLSRRLGGVQREGVARIEAAAKRLGDTLDSVLTLAKFESGSVEPDIAPIDLVDVVEQTVDNLRPLAHRKGLDLTFNGAGALDVPIRLDTSFVARILTNLVGNAIKFTDHGSVAVDVRQQGGRAVLDVRDTGIGMGEDFLERLFKPFTQASTGPSRTHEGTGLGLAIVERLVDTMGGDIDVTSQQDVGTRFEVSFPVDTSADPADDTSDDDEPTTTDAERPDEFGILVVEDNDDICELIATCLAPRTTHIAHSAEQALALCSTNRYSVILMDIGLPEISGTEALRRLRAMDGSHTPVVAMTGHALPGDRQRFMSADFDAYLPKPFSPGDLDDLVGRLVAQNDG